MIGGKMRKRASIAAAFTLCTVIGSFVASAQQPAAPAAQPPMTFFLTGTGSGKGADLGGLAGADALCQRLAATVGRGGAMWRAYLSTQGTGALNARDRIGKGPWHNVRGGLIANNVDELHSLMHRIRAQDALTPAGEIIPGSGFNPNRHDILTGSKLDGTGYPAGDDMTCRNWTSSTTGKARLGHHDRAAWNSAHDSAGCSPEALRETGGDGLIYCFAAQ
jgi:hypothetical protein